jgi:hypothetical protein
MHEDREAHFLWCGDQGMSLGVAEHHCLSERYEPSYRVGILKLSRPKRVQGMAPLSRYCGAHRIHAADIRRPGASNRDLHVD